MQPGDVGAAQGEVFPGVVVADAVGVQAPRIHLVPPAVRSRAGEAIEIAERCGLVLDEWQKLVLEGALGVDENGKWAAFEIGINVARQNGKGGILEALELGGLFAFGEHLIIHSAHQFDTSMEAFLRMEQLLEEGDLIKELKPRSGVSRSHGSEGFALKNGQRLRYRTRTKGGGRGFSCNRLVLDEAMFLSDFSHGALLPTLAAQPNAQVVYTGSAVDQLIHEDGIVFARVRERGLNQGNSLAYFEWSADFDAPDELEDSDAIKMDVWAQANPGLGIRIAPEHVMHEFDSMDSRTFAVERLGVGDWPRTDGTATVINLTTWDSLMDDGSSIDGMPALAFDVSPARTSASISAAGRRTDGLFHVETIQHDDGTGWVVGRLVELVAKHRIKRIVCDGASPAGALVPELEQRRVKVETLNAQDMARACGAFYDGVDQRQVKHLGTSELRSAIKGAATRPLGDAWAWSRKNSGVDITPLVAGTLAFWSAAHVKQTRAGAMNLAAA